MDSQTGQRTLLPELEPGIRLWMVGRVAYLEGSVHCYDRKKALAQLAAGLPSVQEVVNRLRVVPGSPRSDREIEEKVLAALATDAFLGSQDVSVRAADGVVELRGMVRDGWARTEAEAAVWSTCGVRHVVNYLSVRGEEPLSSLGRSA